MKRTLKVKQKTFFVIFKGLSVAKYCLRPESVPLIISILSRICGKPFPSSLSPFHLIENAEYSKKS